MSENITSMDRRRKISCISINDISSTSSSSSSSSSGSNSTTNSSLSNYIQNKRYRNNNDSFNTLDEANTSNEEIGIGNEGKATNSWSPNTSNKLLRFNKKSNLGSISKGLNNIIENNLEAHSKTDNQRGQSQREHYPHFQNDFGNPMSYNNDNDDDNDWGFFI